MTHITVINGPNLNNLGARQPHIYGDLSAEDLDRLLQSHAEELGCTVSLEQHSDQGDICDAIGSSSGLSAGLVINPGGYSHTSVAIMDAMLAFEGPVVEVHISQIHRREPFRHRMLTAMGADALVCGAGLGGYLKAMDIIMEHPRR